MFVRMQLTSTSQSTTHLLNLFAFCGRYFGCPQRLAFICFVARFVVTEKKIQFSHKIAVAVAAECRSVAFAVFRIQKKRSGLKKIAAKSRFPFKYFNHS